jgi:dihydrofolate synthase/folylpolyglutamate synthase
LGAPTTFEIGTAFAFLHFARRRVDMAVVEVGTGGRFDATNVANPSVSVITPISYDHTPTLGSTLTSIAWHKAGIMRPRRPAIVAPQPEEARAVIEAEAREVDAALEELGREWHWRPAGTETRIESSHPDFSPIAVEVGLLGDHQRDNATTAVAALHALGWSVSREATRTGLATVDWPGRLQVISRQPLVVLDGAHNAASAEVVRHALEQLFEFDRLILVLGLSEGKDAEGVLRALGPGTASVHLTRSRHERSADPSALRPLLTSLAPDAVIGVYADVPSALEGALAKANPHDLVLVTGSLFLVGEALVWWRRSRP